MYRLSCRLDFGGDCDCSQTVLWGAGHSRTSVGFFSLTLSSLKKLTAQRKIQSWSSFWGKKETFGKQGMSTDLAERIGGGGFSFLKCGFAHSLWSACCNNSSCSMTVFWVILSSSPAWLVLEMSHLLSSSCKQRLPMTSLPFDRMIWLFCLLRLWLSQCQNDPVKDKLHVCYRRSFGSTGQKMLDLRLGVWKPP